MSKQKDKTQETSPREAMARSIEKAERELLDWYYGLADMAHEVDTSVPDEFIEEDWWKPMGKLICELDTGDWPHAIDSIVDIFIKLLIDLGYGGEEVEVGYWTKREMENHAKKTKEDTEAVKGALDILAEDSRIALEMLEQANAPLLRGSSKDKMTRMLVEMTKKNVSYADLEEATGLYEQTLIAVAHGRIRLSPTYEDKIAKRLAWCGTNDDLFTEAR